ncbi:MAG TPA: SDR family oxidoreductase [Thermoleophilaceae bacterium]|jgi:NAD(P)-dependent dehydrogenase (short-subunit alcohol dehydrogenase family)
MPFKGLQDRVAIVTGAASGIGLASAQRLAQEGARVALVDVDANGVEKAASDIGSDNALAIAADVSDEEAVTRYFGEVKERFGRIDSLHNNAGIGGQPVPLAETTMDDFDRLVRINLRGVFLNLREMIRTAVAQGGGATIVNTASGTALHGVPGLSAYASTKAGIMSLTRNAAVEYAKDGVRVNAVVPGPVGTPLFEAFPEDFQAGAETFNPQGRRGVPDEIAAVVAFLLSDESTYITGAAYNVDGGEGA